MPGYRPELPPVSSCLQATTSTSRTPPLRRSKRSRPRRNGRKSHSPASWGSKLAASRLSTPLGLRLLQLRRPLPPSLASRRIGPS
jgi:hypothetical protein